MLVEVGGELKFRCFSSCFASFKYIYVFFFVFVFVGCKLQPHSVKCARELEFGKVFCIDMMVSLLDLSL